MYKMDTTSLWLHNKLGTSNDSSWTSGSICSQLNKDVLKNIKECFPDLQTQVKLKLLLSFFHIPRRMVEEWKKELEEIIEVAGIDSELWVSMIAETMKTFPATGSLNTEISDYDETRPIFTDMVNDLRRLVNRHNDLSMLPLECQYLNKAAFISVVGQQPQPSKHFTLKRKPKSVQLRAELLQKSVDAQSTLKKASAPTIPLRSRGMPRKMTDTTPLKGIPSRMPTSGFRSPTTPGGANRPNLSRTPAGRKEGGVKLIDFNEQPIGHASAKRRKKQEAEEAHKKAVAEAAGAAAAAGASANAAPASATLTSIATSPTTNSATPDYAAGLTASTIYAQPATPAPMGTKLDNGKAGSNKPLPPLVPVQGSGDLENDIEMVDDDEALDGSPAASPEPQEDEEEEEEDAIGEEEEAEEESKFQQQQQIANQQQQTQISASTTIMPATSSSMVVGQQQQQPTKIIFTTQQHQQPGQIGQQQILTTNNLGQIKVHTTTAGGQLHLQQQQMPKQQIVFKTIDPVTGQRLPYNQLYSQAQAISGNTVISPATSQITMPPGLTVLSTTAANSGDHQQQIITGGQGTPTKIVQIKTAPTTYMMSPSTTGNAPPPLIATQQQGQQLVSLSGQQAQAMLQQQGKKTVLVTAGHQGLGAGGTVMGGNASNMVFVTSNPGQVQSQQLQTAQIVTNAAGQRFVMTPQKTGGVQLVNAAHTSMGQSQMATTNNKPIILSNQTIGSNQKGVIIKSIGPGGAPVYQQIPLSSVTRLQNIAATSGTTTYITNPGGQQHQVIAKKADVPALVPTSGGMATMIMQQQPQATLLTATQQQQPRAPGTTIIRPVLAQNVQQIQGLQGYTIIQRGGPGQPTLIQAIPQQQQMQVQQQQQQQQVQRTIITQQQPTTQVIQQKRQVVVQQPVRKGLTLAPEHANKVTEMFRCANKVTRLDKALILSFIAGQTENPRPNAENVLNITLNQSKEKVRQEDNTDALMMVESVIRLDYNTMEYKTYQRYHRLDQTNSDDTNNNNSGGGGAGPEKVAIKVTQVKTRGAAAATMNKSGS